MATRQLQELIHDLQLNPEFEGDEALQRLAQQVQTELYVLSQRPAPKAAATNGLTEDQQITWDGFQAFHEMLCTYSGWTNRDQWLRMVDVAADLMSRGPQGKG